MGKWLVPSGTCLTSEEIGVPMAWRFHNETDLDLVIDRSLPDLVDRIDLKFRPDLAGSPREDEAWIRNDPTHVMIIPKPHPDSDDGNYLPRYQDDPEATILVNLIGKIKFVDLRPMRSVIDYAARISDLPDLPELDIKFPRLADQASIILVHEATHAAYKRSLGQPSRGGIWTIEGSQEEYQVQRVERYYVRQLQRGKLVPVLQAVREHHQMPLFINL